MADTKVVLTNCPFCDGAVLCSASPEKAHVGHTLPMCREFDTLEPDEFVRAMRIIRHPETADMSDDELERYVAAHSPN